MGLVIGLHGAKGSGKDQFYKAVKEAFPDLDIRKIAYADPIRSKVHSILGIDDELDYDKFKRTDVYFSLDGHTSRSVSGRQIVREIGMLMLEYDQNQYIDYVVHNVKRNPEAIWIVTDVRFHSEKISVQHDLGGTVVKINRNGFGYDGHATETEIPDDKCNIVLNNTDLTLEQYNSLAVETFHKILNDNRSN